MSNTIKGTVQADPITIQRRPAKVVEFPVLAEGGLELIIRVVGRGRVVTGKVTTGATVLVQGQLVQVGPDVVIDADHVWASALDPIVSPLSDDVLAAARLSSTTCHQCRTPSPSRWRRRASTVQ